MNRRNVLAASSVAMLMGYAALGRSLRPRFVEVKTMPLTDWPKRIAERSWQHLPQHRIVDGVVVSLDPLTLSLIAQLVWGLLQYCMAAQVRRQHTALIAHPSGAIEQRMRSRLTRQFLEQHPAADVVEVDREVRAMLAAFREASHADVEEMIADAKARTDIEPLSWETARHAAELTEIAE